MAFLEIDGLKKRYGALEILKGIDLDARQGRLSRAGRPVGLRQVDLAQHDRRARDGHRRARSASTAAVINDLHPSKRDIAMVFQSYALYPNMTVAQNIAFGMEMRGVPKARARRGGRRRSPRRCRSSHLLNAPAQPALGRPAPARRHGPRVGAQAAASSCSTSRCPISTPSCASTCAPRSSVCIRAPDTTIVYVTHDQIEAMTLATKIAVLKDGVLQQVGTPREIYNKPANLFVADFMGSPAMNLIQAKGRAGERSRRVVLERADGAPITLPAAARRPCRRARRRPRGDHRHPPRGDHRSRRRRPQFDGVSRGRTPGSTSCEPAGCRHLRRHPPRRQGSDRADALRRRRAAGPDGALRLQSRQGGAVDPLGRSRLRCPQEEGSA